MHRGLRLSIVVFAVAGALAACSGGNDGNPPASTAPTSAGAQTSQVTGAANGAPKVPAPLPTDEITANPCNALSTAQMNNLGVTPPGTASPNQTGTVCQWQASKNTSNYAFVNVLTADKNGISDIYANRDSGNFAYFEPVQVDGYPGVYGEPKDDRANGSCSLFLGVTDQLALGVSVELLTGSNKSHPCDSANQIATAVVEHLKGAA